MDRICRYCVILLLAVLVWSGSGFVAPARVAFADGAEGRSCFHVFHGYPQTDGSEPDEDFSLWPVAVSGINSTSYTVEYRLFSSGAWGSWKEPLTESPMLSNSFGPYLYLYETDLYDIQTYLLVEWRVVMSDHSGTREDAGEVISVNGQQANVTEPLAAAVGDDKDCLGVQLGATVIYNDES